MAVDESPHNAESDRTPLREPCPIHKPAPCFGDCPNSPDAHVQREIQRRLAKAWDEGLRFGQLHWATNYAGVYENGSPLRPAPNPYLSTRPDKGVSL